jgi:hypothetical protein
MAFNRKWFNIFKTLLPKSNAFNITIQKNLTKFFEGLTALPDNFRTYIDNIYFDIFPSTTRSPELWEDQFGITYPSSSITTRQNDIDTQWKLKGGQSAYYLQSILQDAGFDVQVHENNPKVDPDNFISGLFVMTCGMTTAVCGNDDAYAGKTGGFILANGFLPDSSDLRDYLMVCGGDGFDNVTAGQSIAVCGYFEQFIIIPKTYEIPDDSDYWDFVFFIGGDATRDPVTHELTFIETVTIDSSRQSEFEKLILKIKPVNTWAGMLIDYI